MKLRSPIQFLAAVLAVTAVVLASGCRPHHRDPAQVAKMVRGRVNDMLDDVKATDAQRSQIDAIVEKLLADGQALRAGHADVRKEFLAQFEAPVADGARLHALADQRMDALRAFAHEAIDSGVQVHDILTPDQRAQIAKKLHRHLDGE